MQGIPEHEFYQAIGRFASGIAVITTRCEEQPNHAHGMTASAVMGIGQAPPRLVVSIGKSKKLRALLEHEQRFGVNILSASQRALSDHFAGRSLGADLTWFEHEGLPLLGGAVAQLVCRTMQMVDAGDHDLVIGLIEYARYTDDDPLVYFRGQYQELA